LISLLLFFGDHNDFGLGLFLGLDQLWLHLDQYVLHAVDFALSLYDFVESVGVFVNQSLDFVLASVQQAFERVNHFQVTGRSHVVLTSQLFIELLRPLLGRHVEILQSLCTFAFGFLIHVDILDEFFRHGGQSVCRPLEEPVDSGTVDQRRELSHSSAELVANRGETKHDTQILFHKLDKKGI